MISRKLQGLPIPDIFKKTAIHTLYGCTIRGMINRFEKIIKEEPVPNVIALEHHFSAREQFISIRRVINLEIFIC